MADQSPSASYEYLRWIHDELETCIAEGDLALARRYLYKLQEVVVCMRCKQTLGTEPHQNYFKGFIHVRCLDEAR